MRTVQKKYAEDYLKIVEKAHEVVMKLVLSGEYEAACAILDDCQQGAIILGNMIEQTEGKAFLTVSLLEEYCEAVYQNYEKIVQGNVNELDHMYEKLSGMLGRIKDSVRNDVRTIKEIVFLPYKASMWDSMESVWKAAEADKQWNVYVVPVPYFDKNPDGSFKMKHYEGGLYPSYVPVTGYEEYDIAARRPDIIVIHNPYDKYNYVTSVHPDYYSDKLKQYTNRLVYIPYFIMGEVDPDDPCACEEVAGFCTVPGVINAHKVIVQSEKMRRAYINVMTAFMADQGYERSYWEEKITGTGSPKVDKVLYTDKKESDIPEEWMRIIQKSNGEWKKIFFYNTGVTALLKHGELLLWKMQEVFEIFRENRDHVALLWRPHPLIEATISSMRPQLWEKYKKIVDQYRDEGWGIYDDTADVHRAVALSDAYYGDGSSVMELCRKAGMPVLEQTIFQ